MVASLCLVRKGREESVLGLIHMHGKEKRTLITHIVHKNKINRGRR